MMISPQTPSQIVSGTGSVVRTFVRLKEVVDGVACLSFGARNYEYRGILKINTVNFSLMSEDDQDALIEGFKGFLNGISFPVQILIKNLPYQIDKYIDSLENVEGHLAEMAQDHAHFVRQLAAKRALVRREFYLILPADTPTTKNRNEALVNAQTQIKLRTEELMRQLERLGLTGRRLNDQEIILLYQYSFYSEEARKQPITTAQMKGINNLMQPAKGDSSAQFTPDYTQLLTHTHVDQLEEEETVKQKKKKKKAPNEKAVKSALTNGVADLIAPSSMQIYPWYMRIDGEAEPEYVRTLAFTTYPRSAYPGWLDSIIQVDEAFVDFSIFIEPLSPKQVTDQLGKKAVEFRGSVISSHRQGRTPDPTTTLALQDIEDLRERLARGDERIFNISLFIQIRAKTRRELNDRNNRMVAAVRSLDFRVLPAHWQHNVGFLSCLPACDNQLGRGRLFGTSSAATFYPFTGSDISMETGVMFGVHPNSGLIILNPFNSQELENANMVVFAKSGAGKSFFLKTISCRLLPTCNVYVIDPEAEYSGLCEQVDGQYVRLSSESLQLNPFDLYSTPEGGNSGEESNFFREKLLNLTTLLEILLSDEGSLTQKEKAFIYRCLTKTYENRGITMDPSTHHKTVPNMHEFHIIMSSALRGDHRFGVGEDTFGLSDRLERYLHLFPSRTRVVLDKGFIDFNIRELNESLKPVGLFLITEFLWTKMRQARQGILQRNTIILIDEAWLLMQFSQGAKFLAEFARRIRKYGGGLWCTTQNSDDFLGSDEGRTILAMATMKFLMKQDATTIESVMRTFRLSPGQRNYLLSARRGEGLFATKLWTQMEVVASPREAAMANTTLTVNQKPVSQTNSYTQALQFAQEDFASSSVPVKNRVDAPSSNGQYK